MLQRPLLRPGVRREVVCVMKFCCSRVKESESEVQKKVLVNIFIHMITFYVNKMLKIIKLST